MTGNGGGNGGKANRRRGRVENLKPWKPGQSGNPAGRPRNEACLTPILRGLAGLPCGIKDPKTKQTMLSPISGKPLTYAEAIVLATVNQAVKKGQGSQASILWDRLDGKQKSELLLRGNLERGEVSDMTDEELEAETVRLLESLKHRGDVLSMAKATKKKNGNGHDPGA